MKIYLLNNYSMKSKNIQKKPDNFELSSKQWSKTLIWWRRKPTYVGEKTIKMPVFYRWKRNWPATVVFFLSTVLFFSPYRSISGGSFECSVAPSPRRQRARAPQDQQPVLLQSPWPYFLAKIETLSRKTPTLAPQNTGHLLLTLSGTGSVTIPSLSAAPAAMTIDIRVSCEVSSDHFGISPLEVIG